MTMDTKKATYSSVVKGEPEVEVSPDDDMPYPIAKDQSAVGNHNGQGPHTAGDHNGQGPHTAGDHNGQGPHTAGDHNGQGPPHTADDHNGQGPHTADDHNGQGPATEDASAESKRQTCLFHSRKSRSSFHFMLNLLRSTQILPKEYLKNVGGLVCTCEMWPFQEELDRYLEVDKTIALVTELQSKLKDAGKHGPAAGSGQKEYNQMSQVLEKLSKVDGIDPAGYNRLFYALSMALMVKFDCFQYTKRADNICQTSPRKGHCYLHTFEVKFESTNLGFFFGKDGKTIKQFAQKHDCTIEILDNSKRLHRTATPTDHVKLDITTQLPDQGPVIAEEINVIMARITDNRCLHDKRVVAFLAERHKKWAARRARKKPMITGRVSAITASYRIKANAKDCYSTKYQHMLKDRSDRQLGKNLPKPNILAEGNSWCVNCLLPYDKDIKNETGQCKFHRGYVFAKTAGNWSENMWNCCFKDIDVKGRASVDDKRESHAKSGCGEGRHIWKPHKRCSVSKGQLRSSQAKHAWKGKTTLGDSVKAADLANMIMDVPH